MRTIIELFHQTDLAPTLMVLLPCAYGTPEDFQREGFVSAVRDRALPVDMVLADLNLECITNGTALTSLRDSIISPARKAGYSNIVIVGISIGGFMALSYADHFPGEVDKICLIAPYLGNRMITNEIMVAGGILNWSRNDIESNDHERRIWSWLKNYFDHHTTLIYLGYGSSDRFAAVLKIVADQLTSNHVKIVDGGHDWTTWSTLWNQLLDDSITFIEKA